MNAVLGFYKKLMKLVIWNQGIVQNGKKQSMLDIPFNWKSEDVLKFYIVIFVHYTCFMSFCLTFV